MKNILPLFILLLAGCAAPVPRLTTTASGQPEVIIATTDASKIKSILVGHLIDQGFTIDRDGNYTLELSRPATPGESMAAAMTIGNGYSNDREVITYTFVRVAAGMRVICATTLRAQLPGGQVNSCPLGTSQLYNQVQTGLFDLKKTIESEPEHLTATK